MKRGKIFSGVLMVLISGVVLAQSVPQLINYQGRLTDDTGLPIDGTTVSMEFSIWDKEITVESVTDESVIMNGTSPIPLAQQDLVSGTEVVTGVGGVPIFETPRDYIMDYVNGEITRVLTGFILDGQEVEVDYDWSDSGSQLWSEAQAGVPVTGGIYNVILGSVNPIAPSVLSGAALYLEMKVEGETLAPRSLLTSVPFAHKAASVPDSSITSAMIADGTITGSDIDSQTITSTNIADETITSTQIQDFSIAGSDLQDDSLGATQIQDIYVLNTGDTVTGTLYMYGSPYGAYSALSSDPTDHYAILGSYSAGVSGRAGNSDETGYKYGGYFQGYSTEQAFGIDGRAYSWGTYARGVQGYAENYSAGPAYGVYGRGTSTSTGTAFGGYFRADASGVAIGVQADALSSGAEPAVGVWAYGDNYGSGDSYGGYFSAGFIGTGTHYGVYAEADDYAGWFEGGSVHVGDAGVEDYATSDGDLYVEDALEVDGAAYFSGGLDAPDAIDSSDIADASITATDIGENCAIGEALIKTASGWACGSPYFPNFWTWISGMKVIDQNGVYGTKGSPNLSNIPGSRREGVSWADSSGNFWLFGGVGYAASGGTGELNDLWRWDGAYWTWMSGSDSIVQLGVYGTKGTPDPSNIPGSRRALVSWIDASGDMWLFGGLGWPASGGSGRLNDLWRWDGTNWTWMSGSDSANQNGVYGTKGTPDPANVPGGRYAPVSWTDGSGNFWLFGGNGYPASGGTGWLNDLWRWDGAEWTWMSGSDVGGQNGVYGTKGTPDPANVPGSRMLPVSWVDSSGNLWLFGGFGFPASGGITRLNDLWKWDGAEWTWMSGSDAGNRSGVYGTKGTPDPANVPGARYSAVSWADGSGNMWLFGGDGFPASGSMGYLNDLWRWDGAEWTWMSGSDVRNQDGVYGIRGTTDPANSPGTRLGAIPWTDNTGKLWFFGGEGYPASGGDGYLNDLWRYTP